MQNFRDVYDKKDRAEVLNEASLILEISNTSAEKNLPFGQKLKSEKYHGEFFKKEEVEEFINIILMESKSVAKDLLVQCSKRTFEHCYDYFS